MKIIIRKAKNDYPGSNFRRVDLDMDDGRSIPLFGIHKEVDRQGQTYWEHDSKGLWWFTQADVKDHALREVELTLTNTDRVI